MVDDIIREAIERGEFDNLPGKGKPLNLSRDPLLDPLTDMVHRILRDNGLSHPLIEARKALLAEAAQCRAELARAWRQYQASNCEAIWLEAVENFRSRVRRLNRDVRVFNLKSPSPAFHGIALDPDTELRNATNDPTSK